MMAAPFALLTRCDRSGAGEWRGNSPFRREQIQETWMKLVKTTVIACALSALLAGPVLAQGLSTDTKARTRVQGKSMQGGMSQDEDSSAQPHAAGKVGMKSSKGTKGAAGTAAHKGTVDDPATVGAATSGKH
jgi:hypothetical protein